MCYRSSCSRIGWPTSNECATQNNFDAPLQVHRFIKGPAGSRRQTTLLKVDASSQSDVGAMDVAVGVVEKSDSKTFSFEEQVSSNHQIFVKISL